MYVDVRKKILLIIEQIYLAVLAWPIFNKVELLCQLFDDVTNSIVILKRNVLY